MPSSFIPCFKIDLYKFFSPFIGSYQAPKRDRVKDKLQALVVCSTNTNTQLTPARAHTHTHTHILPHTHAHKLLLLISIKCIEVRPQSRRTIAHVSGVCFCFRFIILSLGGGRGMCGAKGQRRAFLLQLCRHLPGKTLRDKLAAMIRHAHQ